jgi:acylphosphatase
VSPDRTVRRRVIVHGNVQAVFFRDTTRKWALEHDLAGWVRNRDDGTVEVVLEGMEDRMDRVLGMLELGPPEATVEHLEVTEENPTGIDGFDVR